MPTIYSPWMSSNRVRFVCNYTVTKTNGGIDATMSATIRLQTRYSLYDSVNAWSITGGIASKSGSNINFNHGGSGGTTTIGTVSDTRKTADRNVNITVTGLEAYGTISHRFSIPIGALARTVTNFRANSITDSSFVATVVSQTTHGTANNRQVQYNTSTSTSGAKTRSSGSGGANPKVTGLNQNTRYYFRMRVSTTQYGYGPWSSWKNFATKPAPRIITSFEARNITQTSFLAKHGSNNGVGTGSNLQVQYNTSASTSGAKTRSTGSWTSPSVTGLLPGTRYYFRMRAATTQYGWGPWTAWKSFNTLPGVYVRSGGVWRTAIPYVRHGGSWKQAQRYVKVNGVWR